VTAAVTIIYAVYAYRQWHTMERQLNTMKLSGQTATEQTWRAIDNLNWQARSIQNTLEQTTKAFTIEQRPYLIVSIPAFVDPPTSIKPSANVSFTDVGKTPARSEYNFGFIRVYRGPREDRLLIKFIEEIYAELDSSARKHANGAYRQDLAPQQQSPFVTVRSKDNLSAKDVGNIRSGTGGNSAIVLAGFVNYTDAFGILYRTDFCWFFFGEDITTWHFCAVHNTIR
jgi:hypothetical protein